ncbi:hypothetical protein AB5N19_00138 [Seiridium cardinale]
MTIEAEYMARAKELLSIEMDQPSSIPTIQGLLLLGQRDCAHGNLSQGWMYTGMAFRAMRDMGIHLGCSRLPIFGFGTLTAKDREIRRWLFWSAFTWDKIVSLALGRTLTFNAHQTVSPGHIVDHTEDEGRESGSRRTRLVIKELLRQSPNTRHTDRTRPQTSSISSSCVKLFKSSSCVSTLGGHDISESIVLSKHAGKIERLFYSLPADIKLDTASLPEYCPPPHMFSSSLLYCASWTLFYRIFIPNIHSAPTAAPINLMREASRAFTIKAVEMHQLLGLCFVSFALKNMTYILTWSIMS